MVWENEKLKTSMWKIDSQKTNVTVKFYSTNPATMTSKRQFNNLQRTVETKHRISRNFILNPNTKRRS